MWAITTSMPTSRQQPGVIAVNNKIYVIGGSGNMGKLSTVEEYIPTQFNNSEN